MLCSDDRAAGPEGTKDVGPPKFVTQLQSRIEISEGQSAHFEARLTPTEDPNMKVYHEMLDKAFNYEYFNFAMFPLFMGEVLSIFEGNTGLLNVYSQQNEPRTMFR